MISSTVYNEIAAEPTVLVALVVEQATDEGFCVDVGAGRWAVMGLVTFVPKAALDTCVRRVDTQTLTNANTMLFKILATPER
nr:MazF family transcriptional regulator [Frankia canadensis]